MKKLFLFLMLLMLMAVPAMATVRYASVSGSGTACSSSVPCTIVYAVSVAVADDQIIYKNGTCTSSSCIINIRQGLANNGTSGHPITISAETDGGVLINGQGAREPIFIGKKYWIVEGINAANSVTEVVQIVGEHNILRRGVFWNADENCNCAVLTVSNGKQYSGNTDETGRFNLVEDSAGFGTGRKIFTAAQGAQFGDGGDDHNTFRRLWARIEGSNSTAGPRDAFDIGYSSTYDICENCIATADLDRSVSVGDLVGTFHGFGRTITGNCIQHTAYYGSIGYLLASQNYQAGPADAGLMFSGNSNGWVDYVDSLIYIEPGSHTNVTAFNTHNYLGEGTNNCPNPNPAPGHQTITRAASIGATPANTIDTEYTQTNFRASATVAALNSAGAGTIFVNNGTIPTVCYRYVDGVLTNQPLWPWSMNQRIIDGMTTAGRTPVNVTATITGIFGAVPAACTGANNSTYYVNKSGSNSNSCATAQSATPANAKLTIAAGIACLSGAGGDTLTIGAGTYVESIQSVPSGHSGAPTRVQGATGAAVVIQNTGAGLFLENVSFVTISNLIFDGSSQVGGGTYYVQFNGSSASSHDITFSSSIIRHNHYNVDPPNGPTGIFIGGTGTGNYNFLLSHLTIVDVGDGTGSNTGGHGIYMRASDSVIEYCDISDADGAGIQIYSPSADLNRDVIRYNRIHGNGYSGITLASSTGTPGTGHSVHSNLIYGNDLLGSSSGIRVFSGDYDTIYSNTIYGNQNGSKGIWIVAGTHNVIRNNISYLNSSSYQDDLGGNTHDHNLEGVDPLFTNVNASDFTLTAGSPALNAGATLGTPYNADILGILRPQGSGYDIGAYESTAPTGGAACSPSILSLPQAYIANGMFARQLPNAGNGGPTDHLAANSAAIILNTLLNGSGDTSVINDLNYMAVATPGTDAFSSKPFYCANGNDPIYYIRSVAGNANTNAVGKYIHIPNHAESNTSQDPFVTIIDLTSSPYKVLSVYSFGNFQSCNAHTQVDALAQCPVDFPLGTGVQYNDFTNDTDFALAATRGHAGNSLYNQDPSLTVTFAEWMSGTIPHALYINVYCVSDSALEVFPAVTGAGTLTLCGDRTGDGGSGTSRLSIGSLVFLSKTDAEIDAMNLPAWQKPLVVALAHYGAYVGDTTGDTIGLNISRVEGGEAYEHNGGSSAAFYNWLAAQRSPITNTPPNSLRRWILPFLANVTDASTSLMVADECIAKGLAGQAGGCITPPPPPPGGGQGPSIFGGSIFTPTRVR